MTSIIIGRSPSPFELHSQCFGQGHESCNAVLLCALKQDSPDDVRRLPVRSLEAARHALALLCHHQLDLCTPLIFVGDEQAGLLDCHSPPCADRAIHCFPGITTDAFASIFAQQYFLSSVAVVVISVGLAELTHRSQELIGHYQEVLIQCVAWPHIRLINVPPLSSRVAYEMHIELSQAVHQLCRQHKVIFADVLPSFQRGSSFHPFYFSDGQLNVFGVDLVLAYLCERRLLPVPSMDDWHVEQRFSTFLAVCPLFWSLLGQPLMLRDASVGSNVK
uniref:Uncharacterized protein n=1 Tax=Plectus sambesii TaxID=2011161 RepID=A0A914WA03_9BILA